MKRWKRCLSAFLAFTIISTSTSVSNAAGTIDMAHKTWLATEAEVVAEAYGLGNKETDVLLSDAINTGYEYILSIPRDNNGNEKRDLVAVDYLEKKVYAKSYAAGGYTWLPVKAVISAEGETKEEIALTTGTCYYNDVEYYASQAFTYEGKSYRASVVYQLTVHVEAEEQSRILNIPAVLSQAAKTMENGLKGIRTDAQKLENMVPYLSKLLTLKFQKEVVNETVLDNSKTEQTVTVIEELALDPEEHKKEIVAIQALCNEYNANEGLLLYKLAAKYIEGGSNILEFTFEKGNEIQAQSAAMYEYVEVLKNSSRIKTVIRNLYSADEEMYQGLRYLQNITKNMIGTAKKPGALAILNDSDNWTILNNDVKSSIFSSNYSKKDFAQLENAVYALRNEEVSVPAVGNEDIVAAEYTVYEDIQIYEITVTVKGLAASCEPEDKNVYSLESGRETLKLLKGTSEAEVKDAIEALGLEKKMLDKWNAQNVNYEINSSHYDRSETEYSGSLKQDIPDYTIEYKPKYYKIKTNFRGNEEVPFGFTFVLPKSEEEESSFDYVIEMQNGRKSSYNEGVTYKVTESVEITQTKGAEKAEHRLYDFLVSDVQYSMSEEAKVILGNAAIDSPTLNIRVPDESKVGEIVQENGGFSVTASDYSSGILGMTWKPYYLYVMNENELVEKVKFQGETAFWTNSEFTHVKVDYQLKIEKVNGTLGDRNLNEVEDVLYALNLPYELVTDVAVQNQLLGGEEGVSVKKLYEKMNTETFTLLMSKSVLKTIENSMDKNGKGKNAAKRLQEEAWNENEDELFLYTYMRLCDEAKWSLSVSYQKEYYKKIAEQTKIVAECLDAITADPGFDELLATFGGSEYKGKVQELIPILKYLSENLKGPHKALKVNDPDFSSLIELLISMEGKVEPIELSDGIYAYSSIRKNGEKCGTITVSVKVGTKAAKTKEIIYNLENGKHVLTAEEAAAITDYIAELEKELRLTEEERDFYKKNATALFLEGDVVGKNELISVYYEPKEYTVTFSGLKDYACTFKYNSDQVIQLPAYSKNVDDTDYYCYVINGKEIRVNNGKESVGYYRFTKEELKELFTDLHYKGKVILKKTYSQWDVKPVVLEDGDIIRGSYLDFKRKLLFLDINPDGITESQFDEFVSFENGLGKKVETVPHEPEMHLEDNILQNGSSVECIHKNEEGEAVFTDYTVIVMGDVNGDSRVDKTDIKMIGMNYTGTATGDERIKETSKKLAADMNGNGKAYDSNDALLIAKKIKFWTPIDEVVYKSVLD